MSRDPLSFLLAAERAAIAAVARRLGVPIADLAADAWLAINDKGISGAERLAAAVEAAAWAERGVRRGVRLTLHKDGKRIKKDARPTRDMSFSDLAPDGNNQWLHDIINSLGKLPPGWRRSFADADEIQQLIEDLHEIGVHFTQRQLQFLEEALDELRLTEFSQPGEPDWLAAKRADVKVKQLHAHFIKLGANPVQPDLFLDAA